MIQTPPSQSAFSAWAIVVGSIVIGLAIFFGLVAANNPQLFNQVLSPTNSPSLAPTPPTSTTAPTQQPSSIPTTASTSPTVTSTPTTDPFEAQIRQQLIAQTGIPANEIEVGYGERLPQVARGTVKAQNEMGGAAWWAALDNGHWLVVHVGQDVPSCSEVNPYPFPTTWLSHCVDDQGNAVAR